MADNHIDFKYSLRTRYHGAHVLIMVWSFRWVCASGKPEDLQKTDTIACQVLEEMAKQHLLKFSNKCRITFNG
jgi:urocanate hydratase